MANYTPADFLQSFILDGPEEAIRKDWALTMEKYEGSIDWLQDNVGIAAAYVAAVPVLLFGVGKLIYDLNQKEK